MAKTAKCGSILALYHDEFYSMLENIVSRVLSNLIGEFVDNLDADAVSDGLWSDGTLNLHSLELNVEVTHLLKIFVLQLTSTHP